MQCIVFVMASAETEAGVLPTEAELAEMGAFNEQLAEAGLMVDGNGLLPTSEGARVQFTGSGPRVIEGPFPGPAGLVAGYWVWEVKSLAEATEWAARIPFRADRGPNEVEIRPIQGVEDLGEAFTPELKEQEERIRRQIAGS